MNTRDHATQRTEYDRRDHDTENDQKPPNTTDLSVQRWRLWGATLPQLCMMASQFTDRSGKPCPGWTVDRTGQWKPTPFLLEVYTHLEQTIAAWNPLASAANPHQHAIDCCVFALAVATRNKLAHDLGLDKPAAPAPKAPPAGYDQDVFDFGEPLLTTRPPDTNDD